MKYSAGLLMYRRKAGEVEVFLAHPGGPIWASRDEGSWTIPKGEYEAPEEPLAAAQREFQEETASLLTVRFYRLAPWYSRAANVSPPSLSRVTVTLPRW